MYIGEVSRRTGFSKDTLRWYERIGLIKMSRASRGRNNYRVYDEDTVNKLLSIRQMKGLGFTLKETEDLLIMDNLNELNCASVSEIADSRIQLIEQKINELRAMKERLTFAKESCTGNCREVLYTNG